MDDYTTWGGGDILQSIYLPFRSKAFPVNTTLMDNAIGGIGALFGQGLTGSSQVVLTSQAMVAAQQASHDAYCKVERDFNRDMYTITDTANCWLNSKIDRVRKLGQDWMQFGAFRTKPVVETKFPPAVGGMREPLYDPYASYTKRLRNGDEVRVYPKVEDFGQF